MQGSSTGIPIGTVIIWTTAAWQQDIKVAGGQPDDFLECNGQAVDAGKYPKLAKIMATVPNYQGLFLRGLGGNSGSIGQVQGDAIRNLYGTFTATAQGGDYGHSTGIFNDYAIGNGDEGMMPNENRKFILDASRMVPTADENRPINTAVIYLIRAK